MHVILSEYSIDKNASGALYDWIRKEGSKHFPHGDVFYEIRSGIIYHAPETVASFFSVNFSANLNFFTEKMR